MALTLARRAVLLSNSFTINAQKHGAESVAALYLQFSDCAVTKEELPELLLNKGAYKLLYKTRKGAEDEPAWGDLIPELKLKGKVKGVTTTMWLGRKKFVVQDCVLAKMVIKPAFGGITGLAFQLQAVPSLEEDSSLLEALGERVNKQLPIELDCPQYGAQIDLVDEDKDEDADPDADQE